MKPIIFFITLFTGILFSIQAASAQSRSDSLRARQRTFSPKEQERQQLGFYRGSLKVDSAKAAEVAKVQAEYKEGMKALESEGNLSLETRRARIKALMDERKRKLGALLSAEQQSRIIPETEGGPQKPAKKD